MAITTSGKTAATCLESGVYQCKMHSLKDILLVKGQPFPPCSKTGGHETTWILLRKA